MGRTLVMIEVSQKQAYIFASNQLKDNIGRSAEIATITSEKYLNEIKNYASQNMIYSGGGHAILEFESEDKAKAFAKEISVKVHQEIPEIELFIKSVPFDMGIEETNGDKIKRTIEALEKKKSIRKAVFHQGTFGIEEIDANTLKPIRTGALAEKHRKTREELVKALSVDSGLDLGEHKLVTKFDELGGSKEKSNYIAVVHIDGNGMGKRVGEFYNSRKTSDWETFKKDVREFSESIAEDYKAAYSDMCKEILNQIKGNQLKELNLIDKKTGEKRFPVRRVISEGDDICFVTEGRIGIESAVAFLKALSTKKNCKDNRGYSACAGVAIVHQKYPFYRAYQLAEDLCSNAKRFGAKISPSDNGLDISSIDWHIDQGELGDTIDDIRATYLTADSRENNAIHMEMRPYIVNANKEIYEKAGEFKKYEEFKKQVRKFQSNELAARGKIKNLRNAIREGVNATEHYIKFNNIVAAIPTEVGKRAEFVSLPTGEKRSTIFDAIEIMDTYIPFK